MNQPRNDKPSTTPKPSWIHIAAMNLIADHKAGIKVNNTRLAAAYALMADFEQARARVSTEGA